MPQMPDASVIVAGQVLNVQRVTNRNKNDRDEGFKVSILNADESGAVGLAIVKVRRAFENGEAVGPTPISEPAMMSNVAYVVRNAPYEVEGNSGMTTAFVRLLSPNDLDKLISYANLDLTPAGK